MSIIAGNTVTFRYKVADRRNGLPVDADTVLFYIKPPGGDWAVQYTLGVDAELERLARGHYTANLTLTVPGAWAYRWQHQTGDVHGVAEGRVTIVDGLLGDTGDEIPNIIAPTPVFSVNGRGGAVVLAKADVGLGNVDNTADASKPVSTAQAAADAAVLASAIQRSNHTGSQAISTVTGLQSALDGKSATGHGHSISDVTGLQTALDGKEAIGVAAAAVAAEASARADADALLIPLAQKGAANGVAPLDGSSKIASTYLPSFVDDVIEVNNVASLPGTGETGKIYVTLDFNKTWRWSGSAYVEISASPGSTDAVPEGVANLYHTSTRVNALISAAVGSVVQGYSATLAALSALSTSLFGRTWLTHADATAAKAALSLAKGDVGLGNVDNTSDANKPVSTLTQAALDGKQPLDSDLTAIAALTTTSWGRALLEIATAAAFRTLVSLPTSTVAGRLARYTGTAGEQGSTAGLYEDGSGNVGIGTSGPSVALDVQKNGSPAIQIYDLSNSTFFKAMMSGGVFYMTKNGTTMMTAGGENNLFTNTPFGVGGDSARALLSGGGGNATFGVYGSSTFMNGNVGIGTTGPLSKLDVNGSVAIGTYAGTSAAPTNGLIVSGNVGIGTSSPASKLDIAAGNNSGGTLGSAIAISYVSGGYRHWVKTKHDTSVGTGNALEFYLNTAATSGGSSAPGTGNSMVMGIYGNGNVGIGTTAPAQALDVTGNAAISGYALIAGAYNNGSDKLMVGGSVSAGTGNGTFSGAFNSYMTGNGTTASGLNLTNTSVNAQSNTKITFLGFTTGSNYRETASIVGIKSNGNTAAATGELAFNVTNSGTTAEIMRLTSSGNVGIGTTSPSTKLEVSGPARIGGYTAATLPSAAAVGARTMAFVTDSNTTHAAGIGNVVAGGGANLVPVYSNGTDWIIG